MQLPPTHHTTTTTATATTLKAAKRAIAAAAGEWRQKAGVAATKTGRRDHPECGHCWAGSRERPKCGRGCEGEPGRPGRTAGRPGCPRAVPCDRGRRDSPQGCCGCKGCKGSCIIPPVPQWLGSVWQAPQARVVSGLLVAVRWTLAAADLLIEREEGAFLPLLQVWLTGRLRATCKASCLCGRGRTTRLRNGSRHICCTRRGIS